MNIFKEIPQIQTGDEYFDTLIDRESLMIERIFSNSIQNGQWYDQDHDEWIILLQGEAKLAFEDRVQSLIKGDYILIKAHQRHRVESTSTDTVWLTVHLKDITL